MRSHRHAGCVSPVNDELKLLVVNWVRIMGAGIGAGRICSPCSSVTGPLTTPALAPVNEPEPGWRRLALRWES
jgi:hypothetical protein